MSTQRQIRLGIIETPNFSGMGVLYYSMDWSIVELLPNFLTITYELMMNDNIAIFAIEAGIPFIGR